MTTRSTLPAVANIGFIVELPPSRARSSQPRFVTVFPIPHFAARLFSASLPTAPERLGRKGWLVAVIALCGAGSVGAQSDSDGPRQVPALPSTPPAAPMQRIAIAFPPVAPALGAPIPRVPTSGGTASPSPELRPYVSEIFYPQLSARIGAKTLSGRQRSELERYRTQKGELLAQLQTELARLRTADATTRARELAAFAAVQSPKLRALEEQAEGLRKSLSGGGHNWSDLREWWLGRAAEPGYSPLEIAQVMRAQSYYLDGLLPAQRRLLREISLEMMSAADSTEKATAAQPYVFFPPEPARVMFPADLPTDVAARIARYETQKSTLKKELYEEVVAIDGARLPLFSGHTGRALAQRQVGQLAELDSLAEEIRQDLAHLVDRTPELERLPLAPKLAHRTHALMRTFTDAQRAAVDQANAIVESARDLPIIIVFNAGNDGLTHAIRPVSTRSQPSEKIRQRIAAVQTALAAVATEYGQKIAVLINEMNATKLEIAATSGGKAGTADQALAIAVRTAVQEERNELYANYRIAVFQPGLSPEQRRLLFDGALERLDLPLPRAELQPTTRSKRW